MMKIKRIGVTAATVLVAGAFLTPAASAAPAPHSARASVTPDSDARNGGDFGWGNCGFNASGGSKDGAPTFGSNPGLGGFKKGGGPCGNLDGPGTIVLDPGTGVII